MIRNRMRVKEIIKAMINERFVFPYRVLIVIGACFAELGVISALPISGIFKQELRELEGSKSA